MIDKSVKVFSAGDYWQASYYDSTGKRKGKTLGPKSEMSKAAAKRAAGELAEQLAREPGRREVGRAPQLGPWLESYFKLRTDLSDASIVNHRSAATRLREFFGDETRMDKITRARAEEWRAWLSTDRKRSKKGEPVAISAYTQHKIVSVARQIFGWAVDTDVVAVNPFDKVKVSAPRIVKEWRYVSDDETAKIIDAAPSAGWRCLIALCRWAGLRRGEAMRLTWDRIDWQARTLTVVPPGSTETTKASYRVVPIQPRLYAVLEAAYDAAPEKQPMVCPISPNNVEDDVRALVLRAKVAPWSGKPLHTLRKNLVTDWMAQHPPLSVAAWLGHDVQVAANHYHQVKDETIAKVTGGESELDALRAEVARLKSQLQQGAIS